MTPPGRRGIVGRAADEGSLLPGAVLLASFLGIWGLLHLFGQLRSILFITFFSIVFAAVLDYPIALLARQLPRWLATLMALLGLAAVGTAVGFLMVPMFVEQASALQKRIPAALEKAESLWRRIAPPGSSGGPAAGVGALVEQARGQIGQMVSQAASVLVAVGTAVTNAAIAIVLAFFIAYSPREYARGFLRLVPRGREEAVEDTLGAAIESVRKWILGVLMSMTAIGALTAIGLLIVDVDLWLALGVLAFFGEFIPYVGPFLTAVPGIAVGLVESPAMALKVLIVYVVVQQLEGNVVQPLAMRWAVRIKPATLLVWQLAMLGAFGIGGLIIATPLLAALQGAIERGYIQRTLGKE